MLVRPREKRFILTPYNKGTWETGTSLGDSRIDSVLDSRSEPHYRSLSETEAGLSGEKFSHVNAGARIPQAQKVLTEGSPRQCCSLGRRVACVLVPQKESWVSP